MAVVGLVVVDGVVFPGVCVPIGLAERAFARMGLETQCLSSGGGSDVNVFNLKGLPSVNLAAGMERVHTSDEYISVESLQQLLSFLLALIEEAAA